MPLDVGQLRDAVGEAAAEVEDVDVEGEMTLTDAVVLVLVLDNDVTTELVEEEDEEEALSWKRDMPLDPPQTWVVFPVHGILHLPSVTTTAPFMMVLPQ